MIDKTLLLRRVITTLISFLLCIFISILTVCAIVGIACSEKYIQSIAEHSLYADLSYSALMNELEDITIPSGLPIDFFADKIDKELYRSRNADAFSSNLKKLSVGFTLEDIEKEFFDMSYEYALTQNKTISDEANESLQGFAEECASRYVRYVNPSSVKFILTNMSTVKKLVGIGATVSAILGIATAVFLYFLCRKRDLLKHISFALSGASLLSGVLPAILLYSKEVRNIAITSESLYSLTVTFIEGILWLAIIFAIIYLAVVLIAGLIKYFYSKKTNIQ